MQRYFSEQNFSGNTLNLSEDVYKHAVVVMRMKAGSKFELVTPDKVVHVMELVTIDSAKSRRLPMNASVLSIRSNFRLKQRSFADCLKTTKRI